MVVFRPTHVRYRIGDKRPMRELAGIDGPQHSIKTRTVFRFSPARQSRRFVQ